eukprot:COSAG02_NODE_37930_length_435_cov_1.383929_1_plen_48_part_10
MLKPQLEVIEQYGPAANDRGTVASCITYPILSLVVVVKVNPEFLVDQV